MEAIAHDADFTPFSGRVSISLFGATNDWSIQEFKKSGDHNKNPELYRRLDTIGFQRKTRHFLAPRPAEFNGAICQPEDLTEHIGITDRALVISRGVDADGCEVPRGKAFWISSADCPTIIVHSPETGKVVASHGGLGCLIDIKAIVEGLPSRPNMSVIEKIIAQFDPSLVPHLQAFITCGIQPEHFRYPSNHPTHGEPNLKIMLYLAEHWPDAVVDAPMFGKIWLHGLIIDQLLGFGLQMHNIAHDGIDTYGDKNHHGGFIWHSNARATTITDKAKRNGVLVIRHW